MLRLFVLVPALGCATFNARVGTELSQRVSGGGATLACAANAQRTAFVLAGLSAVAGGLGSSAAALLPAGDASSAVAISSAVLATVLAVGAIASGGTAVQYTEAAGRNLSGSSQEGCSDESTVPTLSLDSPRVRTSRPIVIRAKPKPKAAEGARCSEADLAQMREAGMAESAIKAACEEP